MLYMQQKTPKWAKKVVKVSLKYLLHTLGNYDMIESNTKATLVEQNNNILEKAFKPSITLKYMEVFQSL